MMPGIGIGEARGVTRNQVSISVCYDELRPEGESDSFCILSILGQ